MIPKTSIPLYDEQDSVNAQNRGDYYWSCYRRLYWMEAMA